MKFSRYLITNSAIVFALNFSYSQIPESSGNNLQHENSKPKIQELETDGKTTYKINLDLSRNYTSQIFHPFVFI